jgi:membrane protease YdiL (CAAX protease family)
VPELRLGSTFARQFGLRARGWLGWLLEIGIGILAGAAGWLLMVLTMMAVVGIFVVAGGEESLPTAPPEMVSLVIGLPMAIRIAIGLTAGIVEETFFRGFLQPRIGIALSTLFFAMAHLSYDAPFMLFGLTVLSLLFAFLVRWRRNVLAAIVAHATFDLIQLLVVVPLALRMIESTAG